MMAGWNEIKQHDTDRQRLVTRHPRPQLLKARQQKARVARLGEGDFIPPAAEIAGPGKMQAEAAAIITAAPQALGRLRQQVLCEMVRAFFGA